MKTTGSERLEVQHLRIAPDGRVIEPEEQPARIVKPVAVPVNVGHGPNDAAAQRAGTMPGAMTLDGTALGFARDLQASCALCRHFDADAWRRLYAQWTGPLATAEQKKSIADLRAGAIEYMLGGANADQFAVEDALGSCGICHPLTEEGGQPAIVVSGPWAPCNGSSFKPRGLSEEREASAVFDRIMHMAQGKIP